MTDVLVIVGRHRWCINLCTAPKSKNLARPINVNVGGGGGNETWIVAKVNGPSPGEGGRRKT